MEGLSGYIADCVSDAIRRAVPSLVALAIGSALVMVWG
jgi:hypothetical protein